jgi:hypothetical protein
VRIVAARLVTARLVVVRIVVVRIVTDRIAAEKEVQTRKVPLARNSVISSREGLESRQDSHIHCVSGYQNGWASDFDGSGDGAADGADDRWNENMHVDNDGLVDPSVSDLGTEDKSATELGLAQASRNENADRNNRTSWSWGPVEYRNSMLQARGQPKSEQSIFEVAEMGWTLEPEWSLTVRLQNGRRQSDLIDVGQPTGLICGRS